MKQQTISLQNGSIHDCRGCSYETCLHFAAQSRCFYGGSIPTRFCPPSAPATRCSSMCPNYNDAVSANIMALFNRLTNLLVKQDLYQKYLCTALSFRLFRQRYRCAAAAGRNVPEQDGHPAAGLLPHADGARPRLRPDCGGN
ncbi:MAG: hypothetical protein ACLU3I_16050 [Acutalibacteraceae bacterium]